MLGSHLIGVLFALGSAAAWGGADFSGGFAARRSNHLQVMALSAASALVLLGIAALLAHESLPTSRTAIWATAAGIAGALGIAALYRGLASGPAAIVAPTAGVTGASVPVLLNMLLAGPPPLVQQIGLLTAGVGIAVVTRTNQGDLSKSRRGFVLGVLAGTGFGAFFILLAQVEPGPVLWPLVIAKVAALLVAIPIMRSARIGRPALWSNPIALLAGAVEAAGNVAFLLAIRFIRFDLAAVVGSVYPAVTVLLAYGVLKEPVSRHQWAGVTLCLGAIVLIAL